MDWRTDAKKSNPLVSAMPEADDTKTPWTDVSANSKITLVASEHYYSRRERAEME